MRIKGYPDPEVYVDDRKKDGKETEIIVDDMRMCQLYIHQKYLESLKISYGYRIGMFADLGKMEVPITVNLKKVVQSVLVFRVCGIVRFEEVNLVDSKILIEFSSLIIVNRE